MCTKYVIIFIEISASLIQKPYIFIFHYFIWVHWVNYLRNTEKNEKFRWPLETSFFFLELHVWLAITIKWTQSFSERLWENSRFNLKAEIKEIGFCQHQQPTRFIHTLRYKRIKSKLFFFQQKKSELRDSSFWLAYATQLKKKEKLSMFRKQPLI